MNYQAFLGRIQETKELLQARLAVEAAESGVMKTGDDLASMVIAMPDDPKTRAQAKLFIRRRKAAKKARLYYTIDYMSEGAKQIDDMVPDVHPSIKKHGLLGTR